MLTALFLMSIVLAVLLHFLLVERPRMKAAQVEPKLPEPLPLAEALRAVPHGAHLQPTLTWGRVLEDGHLLLGVHPVLISLVGSPYRFELTPEGWTVARGAPLLRIRKGARTLQVLSPVAGKIVEVNPHACLERGWVHPRNPDDGWVYRILPENLIWDLPRWLEGPRASEWMEERFGGMRRFLTRSLKEGRGGFVRADGTSGGEDGPEISVGALADLDPPAWRSFQERFLTP